MLLFYLTLIGVLVTITVSVNSTGHAGLKLRITNSGFTYATALAERMIAYEAAMAKIPNVNAPIKGGPGSGEFMLRNINLKKLHPPQLAYNLIKPNKINWKTFGGLVVVNADWKAYYRILLKIQTSGQVKVTASDIGLNIDATLTEGPKKLPMISISSCSVNIGSLDTKISGSGIIQWIINLFRHDISAKIRAALIENVCGAGKTVLQSYINAKIQTLPTTIPVIRNFWLGYIMDGDPMVNAGSNFDVPINAVITWKGESTPVAPPTLPPYQMDHPPKMLYIMVSDYILNSFLYSAHKHKALALVANNETAPPAAQDFLQTSCGWSICISDFIPGLYKTYPDRQLDLVVHSRAPPTLHMEPDQAKLNASFYIDAYIAPWQQTKLQAFRLQQDLIGYLNISINGSTVLGHLKINESELQMTSSNVGSLAKKDELVMFNDMAIPMLEAMLNGKMSEGVEIPSMSGITFVDPDVVLIDRGAQIGLDIHYTPGRYFSGII